MLDGMAWLAPDRHVPVLVAGHAPRPAADRPCLALGPALWMILFGPPIVGDGGLVAVQGVPRSRKRSFPTLRGAVPIILAVFPLMAGSPHAQLY